MISRIQSSTGFGDRKPPSAKILKREARALELALLQIKLAPLGKRFDTHPCPKVRAAGNNFVNSLSRVASTLQGNV